MQQAGLGTGHRQQPTSPPLHILAWLGQSPVCWAPPATWWSSGQLPPPSACCLRVVPSLSEETRRSPAWSESHCEYTPASPQLSAHCDTTNIPTTNHWQPSSAPQYTGRKFRLQNLLRKFSCCRSSFPSYLLWSLITRLVLLTASGNLLLIFVNNSKLGQDYNLMFMLNVKNFPWYLNKISTLEQGRISRENDFNVFATFNKNTEMNQMAHPSQIQYNSLKIYVNYQVIEGNMSKKRKRKIFIILFSFRGKNSKTRNIIISLSMLLT